MNNIIPVKDELIIDQFPIRIPRLPNVPIPRVAMPTALQLKVRQRHTSIEASEDKRRDNRFIHFAADRSGCGWWRFNMLEQVANYGGKATITNIDIMPDPGNLSFWRSGIKAVRLQRQATPNQLSFFKTLRRMIDDTHLGIRMIYEIDDVVVADKLPDYNAAKSAFNKKEIQDSIRELAELCDEFTVVSPYMKKVYQEFAPKSHITVIPNYSSRSWFGHVFDENFVMNNYAANKARPRVLLAGGGTHYRMFDLNPYSDSDFKHVNDAIIAARNDFKFVWLGTYPAAMKPFIDSGVMEYHPWAHLLSFPWTIKELGCQVSTAPLADNDFNRAKSFIKFQEACYEGIPFVGQDLEPYKMSWNTFNTGDEMIDRLKEVTKDEETYEKEVVRHHDEADNWYIDDKVDDIIRVYRTPYNDLSRFDCEWFSKYNERPVETNKDA